VAHERAWFEMREYRRRRLDSAVWIPLRAVEKTLLIGQWGEEGYCEEFFGAGTLAVPLARRDDASQLGWMDIGISHDHGPFVDDGAFVPSDHYRDDDGGLLGIHLVMQSGVVGPKSGDWIVHPDLVLGLRLIREGNEWLSPEDGYEKVIELVFSDDGRPARLSIRAEYLKDFLCARGMALYVTSYRSHREIVTEVPFARWAAAETQELGDGLKWESHISEIHEGGMPFGERTAVLHVGHSDFDSEQDVPVLPRPDEGNPDFAKWEISHTGRKLYSIAGELWREEWIEPGPRSPRIRGDAVPSAVSFVVDAAGSRVEAVRLRDDGRWLWFRPEVITAIASRRGGELVWYTRETGGISCIPGSSVHFGINRLGLVNVLAKDLALKPEWQQRIWAASNVSPDGGVSEELQDSQVRARPASTQAPEAFLAPGLELLGTVSMTEYGKSFVRHHDQTPTIIQQCNRFRAVDRAGLLALAKDLARLTADLFDEKSMNDVLGLKGDARLRPLKALERVLSSKLGQEAASRLMAPLFGIYDLRLGDAHLPRSDQEEAFRMIGIPADAPFVHQGRLLIHACVSALHQAGQALGKPSPSEKSEPN
jgi:hypothetical protein